MAEQTFGSNDLVNVWLCSEVGARCIYSSNLQLCIAWPFNYLASYLAKPFNLLFLALVLHQNLAIDIASRLIRSTYLHR